MNAEVSAQHLEMILEANPNVPIIFKDKEQESDGIQECQSCQNYGLDTSVTVVEWRFLVSRPCHALLGQKSIRE